MHTIPDLLQPLIAYITSETFSLASANIINDARLLILEVSGVGTRMHILMLGYICCPNASSYYSLSLISVDKHYEDKHDDAHVHLLPNE